MLQQIQNSLFTFSSQIVGRAYLVEDLDGLTLVDSGSALMTKNLIRSIQSAGFELTDVKRVVITHAHPDHASNLPLLKSKTGAEIYAPAAAKEIIEGNRPMESLRFLKTGSIPKWVPGSHLPTCTLEHPLEDGASIPFLGGMIAIATPGHTTGHMSYWQPDKRILFCGDVLIRFPRTRLPFSIFTQDMNENIRSLIKLTGLKPEIILPGHGQPITENTSVHLNTFTEKQAAKFNLQRWLNTPRME